MTPEELKKAREVLEYWQKILFSDAEPWEYRIKREDLEKFLSFTKKALALEDSGLVGAADDACEELKERDLENGFIGEDRHPATLTLTEALAAYQEAIK